MASEAAQSFADRHGVEHGRRADGVRIGLSPPPCLRQWAVHERCGRVSMSCPGSVTAEVPPRPVRGAEAPGVAPGRVWSLVCGPWSVVPGCVWLPGVVPLDGTTYDGQPRGAAPRHRCGAPSGPYRIGLPAHRCRTYRAEVHSLLHLPQGLLGDLAHLGGYVASLLYETCVDRCLGMVCGTHVMRALQVGTCGFWRRQETEDECRGSAECRSRPPPCPGVATSSLRRGRRAAPVRPTRRGGVSGA